jgi:hypothetical protein
MSQKTIDIVGVGNVLLQKRKGTKHIRMSVRADGTVRVGMPTWMPYKAAVAFVQTQTDWLAKHRPAEKSHVLLPDMAIGKAHRLTFYESADATRTTTRIVGDEARVTHPLGMLYKDPSVQKAAERVVIRALTAQAERLLPDRLAKLATEHGFVYRSVSVKRLRTRWGSCDNHANIVLNCHLMQLPWDLIDYVLLHELNHTRIMRHGEPFWTELAKYVPNLAHKRKQMRSHTPGVYA